MLEELFNLVKESSGDAVVNNPDVPNEHNNEVVAEATNTVASGLRNMVAGGGLQNIIALFNDKDQQAGDSKQFIKQPHRKYDDWPFCRKAVSKYKIGGPQANNVANNLIPNVLSNLISKSNSSENNGFSLEGLLNSITGGQTAPGGSGTTKQVATVDLIFRILIGQFTGGGGQSGGGSGLMDIVSKLAGGAQTQQQRNGGGGLMDLIKGFIK